MVSGTLMSVPPSARAQRAAKVWRIGILNPGSPSGSPSAVLRQAFQELGYVEERNVAYVGRAAGGRTELLPELATELAGLRVDVIITLGSEATRAAKQATASIPIVFLGPSYPVEEGLVASFARPGGNVTGITAAQSDHVLKSLQILRDAVPTLADVAVIWTPANPGSALTLRDTESAARPLLMKIHSVPIASDDDMGAAFAAVARLRPGALIVLASAPLFPHAQRVGELAVKLRIPSISAQKRFAEQGVLFSYGADTRDLEPRVAGYVDRIFKGARPADLPVERPTKFELTVNMKTAKALGLTIPQSLLMRADAMIQ
jgi:putative ABC transport system substrate-binding protein